MLGYRRAYEVREGIVKIYFEHGEGWIIPLTHEVIQIAMFDTDEISPYAVEDNKTGGIAFTVKEQPEYLELRTSRLVLQVFDDFLIDIYDMDGKLLCRDYRGNGRTENHKMQVVKRLEGDEAFYGMGDRVDCLNKRHYGYVMWNPDLPQAHTEMSYPSIPFFITLRKECAYGICFDNTYCSYVDFGKENNAYYYFGADEGAFHYYFIAGETMPQVVKNYTYLTGQTALPQLFTLGYHQAGDNQSSWEQLRLAVSQLCSMGLSGMAFVGMDVDDFGIDVTPELLARWVQAGCFTPYFHSNSANEPGKQTLWQLGEEVFAIYKKYIALRCHFVPYYYDLFWEYEKNGLPPMRPLVLHYEKDANVQNLNGEFLIGEHLLVAPVLEPGMVHKLVYLPKGVWYDYWTKEKLEGGRWLMREAPLTICPMYVRAGSILPAYERGQHVEEAASDTLILEVYAGNGRCVHHQDGGEDLGYPDASYNEYEFVILGDGTLKIELTHHGYEKMYRRFIVRYNGKEQEFTFAGRPLTIWL